MEKEKIAILGAGNGAHAYAGYLALKGFDVSIVGIPEEEESRIKPIKEKGGIEVSGVVSGVGKITPENATVSVEEGIKGRKIIFVVVPAFGHEYFAKELAKSVEDGQIICICPDNFGSLRFARSFKNYNIKKDIKIAGSASILFAARLFKPAGVQILGMKDAVPLAALPAKDTKFVLGCLNKVFPQFIDGHNVLEVTLDNINFPIHPIVSLLNLGRIEYTKGDFSFYGEGVTPAVARVMEAVDKERIALGKALGMNLSTLYQLVSEMYKSSLKGDTLWELLSKSPIHTKTKGPNSIMHRYITEDAPYGLVPIASLCDHLNVPCPTIKSVIHLLSIVTGRDFFKEGLTIEKLGLDKLTAEEIKNFVEGGDGNG